MTRAGDGRLRVAVTGATGTLGRGLLPQLADHRAVRSVAALGSRPEGRLRPHPKVRYHAVDVRDADALRDVLDGADVVVHLAASYYGLHGSEEDLHAINVEGTRTTWVAARDAGARRFVFASSAAVYGFWPDTPQPVDESVPMRPDPGHFYSRHKAEAESLLRARARGAEIELVVFRPCGVVGPHAAGAAVHGVPDWLRPAGDLGRALFGAGVRPVLPGPPVPMQFLHEADAGAAFLAAVVAERAGGTYNLAGDGALGGADVMRALGLRPLPVPRPVTAAAVRALGRLPAPVPAARWPRALSHPLILDTTAARRDLGWRPRFTSRQALASLRAALSA